MSSIQNKGTLGVRWYETSIPIRGCQLSLATIKATYRELETLVQQEGDKQIGLVHQLEGESKEQFQKRLQHLREDGFKLTISIKGFNDEFIYSETYDLFDDPDLPFPIKEIFFTNTTSFSRNANGNFPPNQFSLSIYFDKPPLFDPHDILSAPTPNLSHCHIKAYDISFFRSAQETIKAHLVSQKKRHALIHEKFSYDVGLWFISFPLALYWITVGVDFFTPEEGVLSSFRVAFYIYGIGLSLIIYRALFGYMKWAFPVNQLAENKDNATTHRRILSGITLSLVSSLIYSFF